MSEPFCSDVRAPSTVVGAQSADRRAFCSGVCAPSTNDRAKSAVVGEKSAVAGEKSTDGRARSTVGRANSAGRGARRVARCGPPTPVAHIHPRPSSLPAKPLPPSHGPPSLPTVPRPVLPVHEALRYVVPLREGGSLPAVLDTDGGLYVVKFRGAGQGARAL